jgi:integrase
LLDQADADCEAGRITAPAGCITMRRPHIVPLARQVVALLRGLRRLTGGKRLALSSLHGDRPMSDTTMSAALRSLG